MNRYFNTEGLCMPDEHYMVRLDERSKYIKERYVDRGSYFIMNRARQYGKTTTLKALADHLKRDYVVIFMDFQKMSSAAFETEREFVACFLNLFMAALGEQVEYLKQAEVQKLEAYAEGGTADMNEMFTQLIRLCGTADKPLVMLIDEIDSATNNQVFLDFLAQLRGYYLDRKSKPTFQSVILAGVYDIKNLKLKLRPEKDHKYNSPWNIAAKYDVDMSFSVDQIADMLKEYEKDYRTGMDISVIAQGIYEYTSGYPYMVSAVCKIMDEVLPENNPDSDRAGIWSMKGVAEAVKIILKENNTIFDSMIKQLNEYRDMQNMLYTILFQGRDVSYNSYNSAINLASMFGYVKEKNGVVAISNRIFEMQLYNYFLSEEELGSISYREAQGDKSQFISNHRLNMELVLEKFAVHFSDVYGDKDEKFVEEQGRKLFLLYLKPIINGVGNYYIEAQTRDAKRTDVVIDYLGEQYVVELKIWRGSEYHERGDYSCAMKSRFRKSGNQMTGKRKSSLASLLA